LYELQNERKFDNRHPDKYQSAILAELKTGFQSLFNLQIECTTHIS